MSVGNTKYGDGALEKNINGSNNTAFGICSSRETDASWNTSVGAYANMSNVNGISNVALGTNSLLLDISGSYNTALGTATLLNNLANSNTVIGSNSMELNVNGKENVAIGVQTGYDNINGDKNIFIGAYAGNGNIDGSNNTFLGADTKVANFDKIYNHSTAIGYGSIIDSSNQIMLGTNTDNVIIPGNAYLTNELPNYTEQSIVSKKYVDTYVSGGIQIVPPCDCATFEDISLSGSYVPNEIDDVLLINKMRVLVRCQDSSNNVSIPTIGNGIYVYDNDNNSFLRASDCSGNNVKGQATFIKNGTMNKSFIFVQSEYYSPSNEAIAGTDNLAYNEFYKIDFLIGNGLEINGNTLQVKSNITNTSGDPYLTDIGILGTLDASSIIIKYDSSLNGKLKVEGDASFNSFVDVSGTLTVKNSDAYVNGLRIGMGNNNIISNTIFGKDAGLSLTNGNLNVFIGYQSGIKNNVGTENVFVGSDAGNSNVSGSNNSYLGYNAGRLSTGKENVFIGRDAGYYQTGNYNVAIGKDSGRGSINSVASECVTIGRRSGLVNTGSKNVFVGNESGLDNSSGNQNTFIGYGAGLLNRTGGNNSCLGYYSANNNETGSFNVALGFGSMAGGTNNNYVTCVGYRSANNNNAGLLTTSIGYQSGYFNNGGHYNTYLGASSDASNVVNYSTAIGYGVIVDTSNTIVLGTTTETTKIPGKLKVDKDASFNLNVDVSGNLSVKKGSVKYSTTYHTNSSSLNNNSTYSNTFNVSTSGSCTFPSVDSFNVGIQFLITNVNSSSLTINTTSSQVIYSSTVPSSDITRTLGQYNSQLFTAIQIEASSYGWSMV